MKYSSNNKIEFLHCEKFIINKKIRTMKKIITMLLVVLSIYGNAQNLDSLKEKIEDHTGKINALDERVLVNETDLSKLNKIKVSGYIQSQYEVYQNEGYNFGTPSNTFFVRRARVKFTYEATDGVKFVLQPDFSTGALALKDAYAVVNDPWTKTFSLWAGQFNRPNYEVEYSSSNREVLERSLVIRSLYPGEREVGFKLEANPSKIPLKLQIAMLNGNFTGAEQKDADDAKDLMVRATYSLKFPSLGVAADIGAHGYFGKIRTNASRYLLKSDNKLDSLTVGDYLQKQWFRAGSFES